MHELGLVNYVVKTVGKIAEENNVKKIVSVTLAFGEVSGVVPEYLYKYWTWYTKKFPLFDGSQLICQEIPAVTWCDDCKTSYSTVAYGKTCPRCGSGNTWLIRGNEMLIGDVVVEDNDNGTSAGLSAGGEYVPDAETPADEGGADDKRGNAGSSKSA